MEELDPEEQFLRDARNGNLQGIQKLLMSKIKEEVKIDVNCKGKSKSNFGWTPLHLACYFGHRDVVEELLKAGADANLTNNVGDTPLHKAAFTGRKFVIWVVVFFFIDLEIILSFTNIAVIVHMILMYDVCVPALKKKTHDDASAERTEERKLEQQVLEAAREGATTTLLKLLNREKPPNINCTDLLGNTPLHCAAYRAQKQCAVKLLQNGANPNIKNKNGQTVFDLAKDAELRMILEGNISKVSFKICCLFQSTRFFGWRSHWVVLQDGIKEKCYFTVKCFDDSILHFKVSPKSDPEGARKKWLDAIEEHSAFSTHYCSQEQASEEDEDEVMTPGELTDSVLHAETCHGKLEADVLALLSMLKEDGLSERLPAAVLQKLREVCEASNETCSALRQCLDLFSKQQGACSLKLEQEVEKNKILSEALQTLATEHHELEQSVVRGSPPRSAVVSEDDFYDAVSDSDSEKSYGGLEVSCSLEDGDENRSELYCSVRSCFTGRMSQEDRRGDEEEEDEGTRVNGVKRHRTSLPAPMFSRNDFSIWSILRKSIGMELSKITMPVIFNEPLSFLQRLTEYMEHTSLIHQANKSTDSIERMKCVAAFAVSAVASQWERTGKPFNPLLGETYELVREDLGFRLISEQVSHHPPVSAFHAEGMQKDFVFHGSIYPKLKFWGKSVEAEPKGTITLELPKYNEAYTWTNPTCCVHNIIVGQLWIEQYGNVEVINHRTGERCCLNFKPCGLFGKELHKVEGYILDKSKKKVCMLYGKWTECMYTVDPATFEAHKKNDKKVTEEKKSSKQGSSAEAEESPQQGGDSLEVIPGSQLLWKIDPRPANSAQMYSFTSFAMQLNELDEEIEAVIPKTDCRLRPDIRAMENGDIDQASQEKKRLEEKQRAARKNRSKSDEDWKARGPRFELWFHQGPNPHNNTPDWLFSTAYWSRDYSEVPDIY
uniref:Oxysterol-binding protein n=1 Tax=Astyanax mexicanus TaxID=7994 RepID=A0A8B9LCX7_ASTMX